MPILELEPVIEHYSPCFARHLTVAQYLLQFRYFDSDRSGTIDYDEFLRGIKGEMNERRTEMVHQVRTTAFMRVMLMC